MAIKLLISGEAGAGKTDLLRTLDKDTFVVSRDAKEFALPLPHMLVDTYYDMTTLIYGATDSEGNHLDGIVDKMEKYNEKFGHYPKTVAIDSVSQIFMDVIDVASQTPNVYGSQGAEVTKEMAILTKFIHEDRYLDGEYIMPGKILAGQYINDGEKYEIYYFEEDKDNSGYFDQDGNSVQKMFLKAPLAFKYISSPFTTGPRYIEAFNVSTGHRAIDYAANYGTPIKAVGDGTITFAAWNGPYGNMVKIRHNGTYNTNYGHMSKFAVKRGQKVKQGQIIRSKRRVGKFYMIPNFIVNGDSLPTILHVVPIGHTYLHQKRLL